MSFFVYELFSFVPEANAALLAGEEGLSNLVTSIGIADNFMTHYQNLYQKEPFLKDKIMISGLLTNWEIGMQCDCLRFLHDAGASGLIIIPLPDHAAEFDRTFLQMADQLRLPVIQMVPQVQKWSYSEVIDLVMQGILQKSQRQYQLSYSALMKLASIPKNQDREHAMLEILCKNAMLSIALLDGNFALQYQAVPSKELAGVFEEPQFFRRLHKALPIERGTVQIVNGPLVYFTSQRIFLPKTNIKYLLVASEAGPIPPAQQSWVSEVVSFFFAVWDSSKCGEDSLAQSIMRHDRVEAQALAKSLHVDLKDISILYLYFPSKRLTDREMSVHFMKIEQYFRQFSFRPIMARSDSHIAIFLESPSYPIDFSDFTRAFQGELDLFDDRFFLFAHMQQDLPSGDFFDMVVRNIEYAQKVYPRKKVYTLQELQFVNTCVEAVQQGGMAVERYQIYIRPQKKGLAMTDELWNTLAVYLLDADGKIEQTANYLYISISTVKYRIKRIHEYLGYNIHKMPEAYHLYTAMAILRLTA